VDEDVMGRLSLFFPLAGEAVGLSVATHHPPGEDGYFMLTLSPGRTATRAEPRDVTVVLDVSGSMSGEKIGQAKAALHGLLGTLASEDRFRLLAFSNAVRMHSSSWARATRSEVAEARDWVDRLAADGGTNIGEALDEAFRLSSPEERLPVVIFLTDGLPSVGEQSPEKLADRAERTAGRARVFAFGVGHDVNTHLLDRLSEAGRGSTEYVEPGENVERTLGLLATKIRHPVLTEVELLRAPVRVEEIYPVRLPDVFAGEDLVVFGRFRGGGEGPVTVRGRQAGAWVEFATTASFPAESEENAYLPRLWASRKLGHLTRQIWTEGESRDLVEEIRTLALRYGLPSPYTSYLVQEPDMVVHRGGPVPVELARSIIGRQDVPASVQATGATAVRMAEAARTLRDASSSAKLEEAASDMIEGLGIEDTRETRVVAGRIFRMEDGVWTDAYHTEDQEVVRVKIFSAAYFRLVSALDELRSVVRELDPVLVAGADVSIQVGATGLDALTDRDLGLLVTRFRRSGGAR
jgi:Ca-activated chloride channel family protein